MSQIGLFDFIERRKALETEVRDLILDAVARFVNDTGFSPESIDVGIARVDEIGNSSPKLIVIDVRISVPIG